MTGPAASPADADAPLVARAQAGDARAFDALVVRHQGAIAGLLWRFAGNHADLEDLTQETFVRAYRALPRWTPAAPFAHWLRRVAVNVGRDFCRQRARRPVTQELPAEDHGAAATTLAASGRDTAARDAREAAEQVKRLLAHLAPDDRTLLTLHYLEGMPLREIAAHLGWSLPNAKIRALRARLKLQRLLSQQGYHE